MACPAAAGPGWCGWCVATMASGSLRMPPAHFEAGCSTSRIAAGMQGDDTETCFGTWHASARGQSLFVSSSLNVSRDSTGWISWGQSWALKNLSGTEKKDSTCCTHQLERIPQPSAFLNLHSMTMKLILTSPCDLELLRGTLESRSDDQADKGCQIH